LNNRYHLPAVLAWGQLWTINKEPVRVNDKVVARDIVNADSPPRMLLQGRDNVL